MDCPERKGLLFYGGCLKVISMAPRKFVRFKVSGSVSPAWGIAGKDKCRCIEGGPYGEYRLIDREESLDSIEILSPVKPSKVICIGLNYKEHARELELDMPEAPIFFLKAPSAVTGPEKDIIKPAVCRRLDYEAELGIVIKKVCKNIPAESAADYILGYTCFNDVTARDIQEKESQWARAKSFDTFAPCGPYITAGIDPGDLSVKLTLNGEVKQESTTADMIFSVYELVSYISKNMTLYPGDLISAGTPPGVGPMEAADKVEVEIEKTGKLVNYVKKER
ncbi:MAG: fumarylacetoacetate hydrolase family protein [Elusimicrobiota bacterium]|nr:fumarylacetoacetate hydrolase family protein [Elusimicrobiota bacterium]